MEVWPESGQRRLRGWSGGLESVECMLRATVHLRRRVRSLLAAGFATGLALAGGAGVAAAQTAPVEVEGLPPSLAERAQPLLLLAAPQSAFQARRDAEEAATALGRLLESEGYYAADLRTAVDARAPFRRTVTIKHGPLFTIGEAKIAWLGEAPQPDAVTAAERALSAAATGAPAQAALILAVEDDVIGALNAAGYPDARAEPVDALADGEAHTLDPTYQIQPGVRASFGPLRLTGAVRTRSSFIEDLTPFKAGDLYAPDGIDTLRRRLGETGLFDSALVSLGPPVDAASGGPGSAVQRSVLIELTEGDRRTVAFGASASTSEGVGVEADWEQRNLTGRGDALKVAAQAATLQSALGVTYARPNIGSYGRDIEVGVRVEDVSTDAFDQTGASLTAAVKDVLTERIKASLELRASFSRISDARTRIALSGDRDVNALSAIAAAEYVGVEDVLDPVRGVRLRASAEPGLTSGDAQIAYGRFLGEASVYQPFMDDRLVVALRGRLGGVIGPNGAPPDRLFFAGGGGSVRGYEFQSLSPRTADGQLFGGRSLIEASAELRWRRPGRLGYVAFLDAGAAGDSVEPAFGDMRVGAGIGLRYYTSFGPLRFDIAAPLDPRSGDAPVQVYLSIGQAF
ncbi:BamA/TamA family outer membrane protein [bacterium]|nr:BamA/TamA family outer membrane protein [bacterium]